MRCEVLTVPENTGIPANANRRIAAAEGVWSKGITADDILAHDCVENFINYTKENPDAKIIFAKMQRFKEVFKEENFREITDANAKCFCETYKTAEEQYSKKIIILIKNHYLTLAEKHCKTIFSRFINFYFETYNP